MSAPGSAFAKRHVSGMLKHLESEEERAKAQDKAAAYKRMFAGGNWGAVVARIRDVVHEDHLRVKDEQDPASSSAVEEDILATPPAHTISLPSSVGSRPRISTREKWDVTSPGPATPLSPTPVGNAFASGGFWEQLTPKTPAPDTPTTSGAPASVRPPPYSPIVPQDYQGRKAYKRAKDQVDQMALSVCAKRWSVYGAIKDFKDIPISLANIQDCLTGASIALEFNQVSLETTIDPELPKLLKGLADEEDKIMDEYCIRDAADLLDRDTWLQVDAITGEVYTLYDAQRELTRMRCSRTKSKALDISEQAIDQAWTTRIFEDAERMYEGADDDDSSDDTGYAQHTFLGSIKEMADSSSELASVSDYQSPRNLSSWYSSSSLHLSRETTLESQRSSASQVRSPHGHSARSSTSPAKPSFAHQLRTRENSLSHSPSPEKVVQSYTEHVKSMRSRKSSLSQSQASSPETPSFTHLLNSKKSSLLQNRTPNKLQKLPRPARDDSVPNSPSLDRLRKIQSRSQANLTNEPGPEKRSFGQALRQTKSNFSLAASFEKLRKQPNPSQQSGESEDSIPPLPPFPQQLLSKKSSLSHPASSDTLRKFPVPSRESSPFNDPDPEQSSHAQQLRTQASNLSLSVSQTLDEFLATPPENASAPEQPLQGHPLRLQRPQPSTRSSEDKPRKKYTQPREQDASRPRIPENPSHAHQLRAQASNPSPSRSPERLHRLGLQHLQSTLPRASSPIPSPEDSPYAYRRLSPKSDLAYSVKQMNKILSDEFPQTVLTSPSGPVPVGRLIIFADEPAESPQVSPDAPHRPPPPPPQTSTPGASNTAKGPPPSRIITYTDQPVESPKVSPEMRRHRRMAASQTDLSAWAGQLKTMEDKVPTQQVPHRVASRKAVVDHVRSESMEKSASMESIEKFALEALGRSPRPQQEQQAVSDLPLKHRDRLGQDGPESINNSAQPQQQQEVISDLPFRRPDRLRQDGMGRVNNAPPPQQQHPLVSNLRSRRHDRFRAESMETHHDSASSPRQQTTANHPPRHMGRPRFDDLAGISNSPRSQHQLIGNPPPGRSNRPRQDTQDSKYIAYPDARNLGRRRQNAGAGLRMDNMNNAYSPQQQETFGDLPLRGFERNRSNATPLESMNGPGPELPLRSPVHFTPSPREYNYISPPPRQRAPSDLGLRRRNAGRIAPPRHLLNTPTTPSPSSPNNPAPPSSATPNSQPPRPRNFSQSNTPEARPWPTDDSPRYPYPSTPHRRPQASPASGLASPSLPASATLHARIHAKIGEMREGIQRIEERDRRIEGMRLEREENARLWEEDNPDWEE